MLACYFPQRREKAIFFDRCSQLVASYGGRPFILVGDLNTGNQTIDRTDRGKKYWCSNGFDRLCQSDSLLDLWRHTHSDTREWSWLSNSGNGFRIDHALVNRDFLDQLRPVCTYDHQTRESGLTDHSALIIEVGRVGRTLRCEFRRHHLEHFLDVELYLKKSSTTDHAALSASAL
jgi:exonuclease III